MNAKANTQDYIIRTGDPLAPEVRALIAELDAFNTALYPAESNHFDPPEALAKMPHEDALAWRELWADVAKLLGSAKGGK